MDLKLTGKRVLVTGGNSGLGAAIVRAFAAEGARVAINYLVHPEITDQMAAELKPAAGDVLGVKADISKIDEVAAMYQKLDAAWGGIDVLVNNAGIDGARALSWEADPEAWSRVLQINLFGAYYCAREALKRMIPAKSGVIINTSSVHEQIAWSGYSAYCAAKAGVSMMSKTLAQEAGEFGVRVLCVAPGAIRTPINADVWKDPAGYQDLLSKVAIKRVGETQDIAGMVTVLASDVASYVTATSVFIDGGMTDYPAFSHGG
ncbi:MAG TPA: SDR family oxidoreductase [Steroidobacteraceae bacterium]|jgi:NAD(P)-dependent dehydrogenase (short-subunit alcohol dehydrogenase family)|nr:SDR family oxidoreductase [Steroidobacteraceae bacterium]